MLRVEDIRSLRADLPLVKAIQTLANKTYANALLTETRALLVIEISNGGDIDAEIQCSGKDRAELLFWLERLKVRIISEGVE